MNKKPGKNKDNLRQKMSMEKQFWEYHEKELFKIKGEIIRPFFTEDEEKNGISAEFYANLLNERLKQIYCDYFEEFDKIKILFNKLAALPLNQITDERTAGRIRLICLLIENLIEIAEAHFLFYNDPEEGYKFTPITYEQKDEFEFDLNNILNNLNNIFKILNISANSVLIETLPRNMAADIIEREAVEGFDVYEIPEAVSVWGNA